MSPVRWLLEAHLQTRLLHRTTRRIALTEAERSARLRGGRGRGGRRPCAAVGTLKVHAMTGIGQHYLIKAISQYCETYPEVGFDLTLAGSPTFSTRGLRHFRGDRPELPDSGFVSKCIGQTYSILCASPGYIAAHGFPNCRRSCPRTVACAW